MRTRFSLVIVVFVLIVVVGDIIEPRVWLSGGRAFQGRKGALASVPTVPAKASYTGPLRSLREYASAWPSDPVRREVRGIDERLTCLTPVRPGQDDEIRMNNLAKELLRMRQFQNPIA